MLRQGSRHVKENGRKSPESAGRRAAPYIIKAEAGREKDNDTKL